MTRLTSAWRALTPEQRLAGGAAAALFVTMFLPWYQQNAVVNAPRTAPLQSRNLNAFQVFSFVEAAVLLVAVAVLYLLFARGERRSFQLPGGDGTVVLAAGIWVALLLILRLFDKPGITTHGIAANVGIQWGIFFALAAAGMLALAGSRMRAGRPPIGRRSEPPLRRSSRRSAPAEESPFGRAAEAQTLRPARRPEPADRSSIGRQPDPPPAQPERRPPPPREAPSRRAPRRPAAADDVTEQLSFEDHDTNPDLDLVSDPAPRSAPKPDQR
jgi:hypothetical protein